MLVDLPGGGLTSSFSSTGGEVGTQLCTRHNMHVAALPSPFPLPSIALHLGLLSYQAHGNSFDNVCQWQTSPPAAPHLTSGRLSSQTCRCQGRWEIAQCGQRLAALTDLCSLLSPPTHPSLWLWHTGGGICRCCCCCQHWHGQVNLTTRLGFFPQLWNGLWNFVAWRVKGNQQWIFTT